MPSSDSERLNKLLALELGVSRREADDLISAGSIRIGDTHAILGARVAPTDTIYLNDTPLSRGKTFTYLILNKPIGYVCSRKKQGDNETIYSILPKDLHELKPVGRLDKDSSGLLILTNDGDFAYQMTHPKFHKTKEYEIQIDKPLAPLHQQMISDYGLQLDDGLSKLSLERLSEENRTEWKVLMHEGRNRQIRRTFGALDYTVTRLYRTVFGPYRLDSLAPGDYQTINKS